MSSMTPQNRKFPLRSAQIPSFEAFFNGLLHRSRHGRRSDDLSEGDQ